MDKYFTSFRLLTHLGVNKIRATRVLNKIGYAKQLQKNEFGHFGHLASSESCEPEGFVRFWNKIEKNLFKSNNQISSTVTTRKWVLSTEWTKT